MRVRSTRALALAVLLGAPLLVGTPATAIEPWAPAIAVEAPVAIDGTLTDQAGALGPEQAADVRAALDAYTTATGGGRIVVVYVTDFGGLPHAEWAQQTSDLSGLGPNDVLLAVATGERQYDLSPSTTAQLGHVAMSSGDVRVRDALSRDDWAGAATALAESLGASYRQDSAEAVPASPTQTVTARSDGAAATDDAPATQSEGGFLDLLVGLLASILMLWLIWWLIRRAWRKRHGGRPAPRRPAKRRPAPAAPGRASLADLLARTDAALLAADESVRAATQDLGFAQAQLGPAETAELERVLPRADADLTEAFRLRREVDDAGDPTRAAQTAGRVLTLVQTLQTSLAAARQRIEDTRSEQLDAGQALDRLRSTLAEQRDRLPTARERLADLASRYPADALIAVQDAPERATELIDQAEATLDAGQHAAHADDLADAANRAREARTALGRMTALLDAVDRHGAELSTVGRRLDAATASIGADLADVDRLAAPDPAVDAAAGPARAALDTARTARSGIGDPFAALDALARAEAELDDALAPHRADEQRRSRADRVLADLLGRIRPALLSTADFVNARADLVDLPARARLREGEELFNQAVQLQVSDPARALPLAQRADRAVAEAIRSARADVDRVQARVQQTRQVTLSQTGAATLAGLSARELRAVQREQRRARDAEREDREDRRRREREHRRDREAREHERDRPGRAAPGSTSTPRGGRGGGF